jgi:outer membrane autotransporter protein
MKKTVLLVTLFALVAASTSFAQALNTSDIRGYVGSFYIGEKSLRQAASFSNEQLLYGLGISIGGDYSDFDVDEDTDRRFEGNVQTFSGSVAYVHAFEDFNLGIVLTTVSGELDVEGTLPDEALKSDGDGFLFTLGAAKQWERLSLTLTGTIGELSFDSERESALASAATKKSDYDVTLYQLELTALYALIQNEDFHLSPFLTFGYSSLENDAFEESATTDSFTFDSFEDDSPYVELGINGQLLTLGNFVPYAAVSVWQDLGDDEVEFRVARVGRTPEFETPDAAQTVFYGNVGFAWMINQSWDLDAGVGYFSGDKIDGFNLSLSTTFSF